MKWKIGKWLLVAAILWSPIVGIYDVVDAFSGQRLLGSQISVLWPRVVREGLIMLFYLYFTWLVLSENILLKITNDTVIVLGLLTAALASIFISVLYSYVILELPLLVVILGLKMFLYAPMFICGWAYLQKYPEAIPAIRRSLLLILCVELLIGIIEVRYMPPIYGETFAGSLPIGTFAFYIIYSTFLCSFVFAALYVEGFKMPRLLLVATLFMILIAGSRTGVIVASFLVFIWFLQRYTRQPLTRLVLFAAIPMLGMILIAVLPELSGRPNLPELSNDPRVNKFYYFLNRNIGFWQVVLGSGVGLASGATASVMGKGSTAGQLYADSLHLWAYSEYGVLGLLCIYTTFITFTYKYFGPIALVLGVMIMLNGVGTNFFENYPANLFIPLFLAIHLVNSRKRDPGGTGELACET